MTMDAEYEGLSRKERGRRLKHLTDRILRERAAVEREKQRRVAELDARKRLGLDKE